MFQNSGVFFCLRSPKRCKQLGHRRTLLGDPEASKQGKWLTMYSRYVWHFQKCWLFKMSNMKSWNIHRNMFHASDPAIRPYIATIDGWGILGGWVGPGPLEHPGPFWQLWAPKVPWSGPGVLGFFDLFFEVELVFRAFACCHSVKVLPTYSKTPGNGNAKTASVQNDRQCRRNAR